MKVAIAHYHLQKGGVTKVIGSQLKALKPFVKGKDPIVFSSAPSEIPLQGEIVLIPELAYLPDSLDEVELRDWYRCLSARLEEELKKHEIDVLHFHNLNLGKNPLVTLAVRALAESGFKVLNHTHDFAEDNRPENMARLNRVLHTMQAEGIHNVMYPDLPNLAYATLTSKDVNFLKELGAPPHHISVQPNPIEAMGGDHDIRNREECLGILGVEDDLPNVIYPVRVIRRKNIGEFILLSVLFQDQANWFVTMAPQNPIEIEDYQQWEHFCEIHNIRIGFNISRFLEFEEAMQVADFIVTTSRVEGFGMAFLESWMHNKEVIGRDLPLITCDFKEQGVLFEKLYKKLSVHCLGLEGDFASFDKGTQRKAILSLMEDPGLAKEIITENALQNFLHPTPQEMIDKNREIISDYYSLESCGRRLMEAYAGLL